MKKLLLAAVVGGIVLFVWGAVSHSLLPFYNSSFHRFTDESAVTRAIEANAPRSGMYFMPYEPQRTEGMTDEQYNAAVEEVYQRISDGPFILAAVRIGPMAPFWQVLLIELLTGMVSCFLVGWLLLKTKPMSLGNKLLFIQGVLFAIFFAVNVSHWAWYEFSTAFTLAELFDQVVGWVLAGLVIARILPTTEPVA